ncbi:argininosuccinate lyase [Candidatus Woesearchaeota archaeon]|nr:argininosuccinate lyase [Candidatus Woesearchaeota archaeon]
MKIWDKGINLKKEIEKFTVGNDHELDKKLVKFDCLASIAHAKMLKSINLLSDEELEKLVNGLNEIIELDSKNQFLIKQDDEDCHTAIENYLVKKCGGAGGKIQTARSRNDQVITALRLYEKDKLGKIKNLIQNFSDSIEFIIKNNGSVKIPGYTHMQKAMPTDIKTWLGGFNASMQDNLHIVDAVIQLIDQNPLGSAAGFGVPEFEINKEMTAKELNFSEVMKNPLYCQLSRGKFEAQILNAVSAVMFDLNKLATDLILFNMKEFGYVELPAEFCTGSSIMPQKKNPDVLELIRAKYHVVLGDEFKVKSIIGNLISGYNRDMQLTKGPLIDSLEILIDSLTIISLVIVNMKINKEKCEKAITKEMYATQEAYKLVKQGIPFREAYKEIGKKYQE